jgi:type II secretory pathway pseudopilin PulG
MIAAPTRPGMKITSPYSARRHGFSLIEIILAIGVFALTIVAVLAMLGSTSQATSDVLNTVTASQISDAIRTELEAIDFRDLDPDTGVVYPVTLYGLKSGRRVVLESNADDPDPSLAIYARDRFFLLTIDRLGNELDYDARNAHIALSVRVEWPYNVPLGPPTANPRTDDARTTDSSRRSVAIFNVSVPRSFP